MQSEDRESGKGHRMGEAQQVSQSPWEAPALVHFVLEHLLFVPRFPGVGPSMSIP